MNHSDDPTTKIAVSAAGHIVWVCDDGSLINVEMMMMVMMFSHPTHA
jgi:hypothetical protein